MSYGQGSVTLERGRYRVRVPTGKGKHSTVGYYDTEEEAEQMRAAALQARAELPACPTLRAWGALWLESNRDMRDADNWANRWVNHVLRAPFADDPLDTITTVEVDRWCRDLVKSRARRTVLEAGERSTVELGRAISRQTAQHALGMLRRCLDAAVRAGHIDRNPARGARLPRPGKAQAKPDAGAPEFLPAAEVERLLGWPDLPLEQRTVFTVAICQGLREGEVAALRWEQLDWSAHSWTISASWDGPTKNGETCVQTLLPRAEAALRAWWSHLHEPKRGFVFPAHRGRQPVPKHGQGKQYAVGFDWGWSDHPEKNVTRLGWWRRAGLRTCIPFHGLRDTCGTHLLSGSWGARWELIDVSRHLRHSDPRVTAQRYAHLTPEAQRRAALALSTGRENLPQTRRSDFRKAEALPGELESPAVGLGSPRSLPDSPTISASDERMRQVFGRFAAEIRALVATGADVPEPLLDDLFRARLSDRGVELALGGLAAREHKLQRALELIEHEQVTVAALPRSPEAAR